MISHNAIAIDGPSGAGKSTVARLLADRLGYIYVDTGAMYRAVGLFAARRGVSHGDRDAVVALLPAIRLRIERPEGEQHVFLNDEDVSAAIRTEEASVWASEVSAIPAVRGFLLDFQRAFARENNVIMDGRDIGTVVLPEAGLKIFLTASAAVRAERRYQEQRAKGLSVTREEVLSAIERRDRNDMTRAAAPLRAADDAVTIDGSGLTLAQTVDAIARLAEERFQ